MKSTYLTPLAYAALLFAFAIANAQSSKAPSEQPSAAPVSSQVDTTKGNTLVGTTPTDQTATPPSAGEDTHGSMKLASAARPDFDTLDVKKTGALTADEVKSNTWLSTNFTRCDTNHDGKLSREEYAACK